MNLFLIVHDDDGENMDWFVVANDRDQAVELWRSGNAMHPGIPDEPRVFLIPAVVVNTAHVSKPKLLGWDSPQEVVEI